MKIKLLAIIFALLLVPIFASADITISKHENLFSAYAVEPMFQVCEGSARTNVIRVSNDGEFRDNYNVFLETDQEWFRLSKNMFSLDPQKRAEYMIFVDVPFGTEGDYPFTTTFESKLGRDEQIEQILHVERCQNIKITVYALDEEVLPCSLARYRITVENVADFGDNYVLDFGKANQYAKTLDNLNFYLQPGEVKEVNVAFMRECAYYGEQDVPVQVVSEDNQLQASVVDTYDILRKYTYTVDMPQSYSVCADVQSTLPFNMVNKMHFGNEYDVSTNTPAFASIWTDAQEQENEFTVEIPAESVKEFAVIANPKLEDAGNYNIRFETTSKLGEVSKKFSSELEVEKCYDFNLQSTLSGSDKVEDKVCAGKYTYEFNVVNTGTRPQEMKAELHGPEWMKLEGNFFTLQPGENKNIEVYIDTPNNDMTQEAYVEIHNVKYPHIKKQMTIDLEVVASYRCHQPAIDEPKIKMLYDTKIVPMIIKNVGTKTTTYNIYYEQQFTELAEPEVTIEPGQSQIVHLMVKENVKEFVEGGYPATVSLSVDKPGDEYADGIVYQLPIKLDLHKKSFIQRWYEKIVYDIDYKTMTFCQITTIIIVLILGLTVLLLLANMLRKIEGFAAGPVITILAIIAIIALLIASITIGAPKAEYNWEPRGSMYDELFHEWGQGTNFQLDIKKYFMDPDGDDLRYTSSQPTDISVRIDGNVATFKPDAGFKGTNEIVFTAYDDRGGVTDSAIITLSVVPVYKTSSLWYMWIKWCKQINIWLLIVVLVLMLLIRRKKEDSDEKDDDDFDFSDFEESFDEADEEYDNIFETEKKDSKLSKTGTGLFVYKKKDGDEVQEEEINKEAKDKVSHLKEEVSELQKFEEEMRKAMEEPLAPKVEVVEIPKKGIFIASKTGSKVHKSECITVKRIPDDLRLYFNDLEDATKEGYKPCGMCLKDEE